MKGTGEEGASHVGGTARWYSIKESVRRAQSHVKGAWSWKEVCVCVCAVFCEGAVYTVSTYPPFTLTHITTFSFFQFITEKVSDRETWTHTQ